MSNNECTCPICVSFCKHRVGWFLPNEAERVAEFLGITLKELFDTKLGVDFWCGDGKTDDIFLLAPAKTGMRTGSVFPFNPKGRCCFLDSQDSCTIHPVKPYECRKTMHDDDNDTVQKRHKKIASAWKKHQAQVEQLLGFPPYVSEPTSFMEMFLFGG